MPDDISKLDAAEEAQRRDYVYLVSFEVLPDMEGPKEWEFDELKIAAGPDAQLAINKARDYVTQSEEEYGMKVLAFRLKQIKLLAIADL